MIVEIPTMLFSAGKITAFHNQGGGKNNQTAWKNWLNDENSRQQTAQHPQYGRKNEKSTKKFCGFKKT
jgi:hypothetical protein